MKPIIKKSAYGGHELDQAHANPPKTATEATSRWKSFGHKDKVERYLLDEQYGLCCYSELRADLEGLGYHIEHVHPKSLYPEQTFDYNNLAASALSDADLKTRVKQDIFGAHAKLGVYDSDLFVSCHDADCARYFAYLSDGRVEPSLSLSDVEKARAIYTRDLLNLNSSYLVTLRRHYYTELEHLFDEYLDKDLELEELIRFELAPSNGRMNPFFSLTRQFFGHEAEKVLQQHLPDFANS